MALITTTYPVGHEMGAVVSYVPGSGYFVDVDGPSSVATANGLGQRNPVGFRVHDNAGSEYIYLPGVASLAAGDFVLFNNNLANVTTTPAVQRLPTAATFGQVAVAMAAIVANCWGWFQIYGLTPAAFANIATGSSDGLGLAAGSATGRAQLGPITTKNIFGAVAIGNAASNVGQAYLSYPYEFGSATI